MNPVVLQCKECGYAQSKENFPSSKDWEFLLEAKASNNHFPICPNCGTEGNGHFDQVGLITEISDFFFSIHAWAGETFGVNRHPVSGAIHLIKEAKELYDEVKPNGFTWDDAKIERIKEELADCLILVFNTTSRCGFSFDQLYAAAKAKMEVNKKRRWGPADQDGVSEHVKEGGSL